MLMERFNDRVDERIVEFNTTIIQAMKQMDVIRSKSLLVFDNGIFLGLITIGDLQRAIIANKPFDTPVSLLIDNEYKKYAYLTDDIKQIKNWMLEVRAEMMPVLDAEGNVAKVIFWDDLFEEPQNRGRQKIDLPVVIMAGGKGIRLKPITNVLPKPLIPVGEKTILEVIMDQFEKIGCHTFYMSVNYKADMIKSIYNSVGAKIVKDGTAKTIF